MVSKAQEWTPPPMGHLTLFIKLNEMGARKSHTKFLVAHPANDESLFVQFAMDDCSPSTLVCEAVGPSFLPPERRPSPQQQQTLVEMGFEPPEEEGDDSDVCLNWRAGLEKPDEVDWDELWHYAAGLAWTVLTEVFGVSEDTKLEFEDERLGRGVATQPSLGLTLVTLVLRRDSPTSTQERHMTLRSDEALQNGEERLDGRARYSVEIGNFTASSWGPRCWS